MAGMIGDTLQQEGREGGEDRERKNSSVWVWDGDFPSSNFYAESAGSLPIPFASSRGQISSGRQKGVAGGARGNLIPVCSLHKKA